MENYEVFNAVGNTDLSIYIGRRGLGEEKLTSLVIEVNPNKGGKKTIERMNTFGVLRNISLTVIMLLWEQSSRVFSCHFLSGLCHFFWT